MASSDIFKNLCVGRLIYLCSGSKIFSTFIGFLKSKDPGDGTEKVLLDELTTFNDYIKENVSSFVLDY